MICRFDVLLPNAYPLQIETVGRGILVDKNGQIMTNSIRPLPASIDAQYDYTIKISGLNVFLSTLSADERAALTRIGAIVNTKAADDDNLTGIYLYLHLTMLPMSMYSSIDSTASEIMTVVSTLLFHTTGIDIARSINLERESEVHEETSQIKYLVRVKEGHDTACTRLILSIMSHFTVYVQQSLKKMHLHMPRLPYEATSEFIAAMNTTNDADPLLVDHMQEVMQRSDGRRRQQRRNEQDDNAATDDADEGLEQPAAPSTPLSHNNMDFEPLHDENSEAYSDDYITHLDISDLLEAGAAQVFGDEVAAPEQDGVDDNGSTTFRSVHSDVDLLTAADGSPPGSVAMSESYTAGGQGPDDDVEVDEGSDEEDRYYVKQEQVTVADVHPAPLTPHTWARDNPGVPEHVARDELLFGLDDDDDMLDELDEPESNERLHGSTSANFDTFEHIGRTEYALENMPLQPGPSASSTVASVGQVLVGTEATDDGTELAADAIYEEDDEIEDATEAFEDSIATVSRGDNEQVQTIVPSDLLAAFPLPSIATSITSAVPASEPNIMIAPQGSATSSADDPEQENLRTIPSAAPSSGASAESAITVTAQETFEAPSTAVPFVSIIPTTTTTAASDDGTMPGQSSHPVDSGNRSQREHRNLYKTPTKTEVKKTHHPKASVEAKAKRVKEKVAKRAKHKKEKKKRRRSVANDNDDDTVLTATEQEIIKAKADKKARKIARRLAKAAANKQEDDISAARKALITTSVDKSNDNMLNLAKLSPLRDPLGSTSTTADLRERMGISLALNRDTDAASASTTADLRERMGTALTISSAGTNRRRKSDDPPEIDDLETKVARQSEGKTPWEQNVWDEKWNQLLRRMPGAGHRMEDDSDDVF